MLWICLACCWTPATSFASSSVWSDQPHSHSTRFCIPHLLNSRPRRGKGGVSIPEPRVLKIIAGRLWRMFGGSLLRIYLTGEVAVERGEHLLRDADLAGRQGRLALVYLVSERERAVTQSELAELLWPESLPQSWPVALSAGSSRPRKKLATAGLHRDRIIANAFRCYQSRPPADTWIDLEAAADALHQAEGAVQANQPQAAYGPSLIATTIARRPFLVGEAAPWVTTRRERLRDILVRALDCRVEALVSNGELALAQDQARAAVELEPFRESGYRRLMQVLVKRGDRAEAVRVYQDCKRRLAAELGVTPSEETESLLRTLLSSTTSRAGLRALGTRG